MKCSSDVLEQLLPWQQICFAAAIVSRMLPNYQLFCEVSGQGELTVFNNILQLVWEHAAGQNNKIDFSRQQDKLQPAIPDPAQFDGYGVWPALDATTALSALLSACEQRDVDEVLAIEQLSRSTIEQYLQFSGEPTQAHPLIAAEQAFIQAVLACLQEQDGNGVRQSTVADVKTVAYAQESSNIGISISQ